MTDQLFDETNLKETSIEIRSTLDFLITEFNKLSFSSNEDFICSNIEQIHMLISQLERTLEHVRHDRELSKTLEIIIDSFKTLLKDDKQSSFDLQHYISRISFYLNLSKSIADASIEPGAINRRDWMDSVFTKNFEEFLSFNSKNTRYDLLETRTMFLGTIFHLNELIHSLEQQSHPTEIRSEIELLMNFINLYNSKKEKPRIEEESRNILNNFWTNLKNLQSQLSTFLINKGHFHFDENLLKTMQKEMLELSDIYFINKQKLQSSLSFSKFKPTLEN